MGKSKLGAFIRKIDYLKAKDGNDYEDSDQNPCNQLIDVADECDDMTIEEFKDAFAAFEEKICVPGFPEKRSPARDVAYSTVCVLNSMANSLDRGDEKVRAQICSVLLHALVALFKAGPGSTHIELMDSIRSYRSPPVEDYTKTIGQKELQQILVDVRVNFKPQVKRRRVADDSDDDDDDDVVTIDEGELERFFCMFTTEQYKLVQKEFLETYIHYSSQIPSFPEKYGLRIYYLVRGMKSNIENENPYLNLKDAEIIKRHLNIVRDMVLTKGYKLKCPTEDAAEQTLKMIIKAVTTDGYLDSVFDHLMSIVADMHKNENFRKEGGEIYKRFSYDLFRDLKDKKITPTPKMFQGCVKLVIAFVAQGELTSEPESVLTYALEYVVQKTKPVPPEDVKLTVSMVHALVGSGRQALINQGEKTLQYLTKLKALDWKKHVEEAKQILATIAKIPQEKLQDNKEAKLDKTQRAYRDFMKVFREQLKKSKVLPQLQECLVDFVFDCMVINSPLKAELGEETADRDFMDFSKKDKLRLVVLKRAEGVLKMDLPWQDTDMIRSISNILQRVVESYDGNGKKVTEEENRLFMSIFKIASEGGECVVDHFYQEEHDDRPNHRMLIWRDVLQEYTRVHQETATMSCIAPIMPEILRWSKISLEDDHDDMMHLCYGLLNWVGLSTPPEFKSCLPEIVDLMLESEKFNELYSIVNALYPHNPAAVHDRLQDFFDKLEDLKDSDRHMVTALLQVISQKHPEAFSQHQISTLFDMYSQGNEASKPLILIIIRSIGEKHPENLVDFLGRLCDSKIFKPDSMNLRSGILVCIGGVNEKLGEKVVDYLMKYVDHSDPTVSQIVTGTVGSMVRNHVEYMQKYKPKLEDLEQNSTIPQVREQAHNMILILEGKSVENIVEDIEQQKEDIENLDTKVDATIDTVVTIGDKVIEHDKEIGELEVGLEQIEERVDDVEEDVEETKIKVEEIDNKTMTNAPKWSRDLTKLMNPTADNDWRLLASRLGYTNDDIRGWATQHDPCMALLSEWYATHKTSEASFGVLTALVEMNRMDGAAIVENAMKTAEGVVEDEEFEYPSPPPVFISYQWGFQNEVKLLKHHLNMAGYECWMDVGQMGGGDKLFAKIDNGIRGAKIVICCVTEKYAQSPNCNREVNLSVNLNKPIIPLLMEKMGWPPKGSMGPIFSEYLFIRFFQRGGEETPDNDQRYWPIPKFQELLMQLNFFVVPDEKLVQKEYSRWWAPMVEDIVIDKDKAKKKEAAQKQNQTDSEVMKSEESPLVFLSYQWGKQPQIKALYQRLTYLGYTVWMDIYQMGGGDSLYDKIDRGMRGCKAVVSCVTQKYSLSANCRREVSLADALKKPIIPLLLEQMKWPPDGPMSMMFTELLYINFYRDEAVQMTWKGDQFDELIGKLSQFVPTIESQTNSNKAITPSTPGDTKVPIVKKEQNSNKKVNQNEKNKEEIRNSGASGKEEKNAAKDSSVAGKPGSRDASRGSSGTSRGAGKAGLAYTDKGMSKTDDVSGKSSSARTDKEGTNNNSVARKPGNSQRGADTPKTSNATRRTTNDNMLNQAATGRTNSAKSGSSSVDKGKSPRNEEVRDRKTVQRNAAKKVVVVNAFGGSIVKDRLAQDIAAGKKPASQSGPDKTAPKGKPSKTEIEDKSNNSSVKATKSTSQNENINNNTNGSTKKNNSQIATTNTVDKQKDGQTGDTRTTTTKTSVTTQQPGNKQQQGNEKLGTPHVNQTAGSNEKDTANGPKQSNSTKANEKANGAKSKSCVIL